MFCISYICFRFEDMQALTVVMVLAVVVETTAERMPLEFPTLDVSNLSNRGVKKELASFLLDAVSTEDDLLVAKILFVSNLSSYQLFFSSLSLDDFLFLSNIF